MDLNIAILQIKKQNKGTDQGNQRKQGYRSIFRKGKTRVQINFTKQGYRSKHKTQAQNTKTKEKQGYRSIFPDGKTRVQIRFIKLKTKTRVQIKKFGKNRGTDQLCWGPICPYVGIQHDLC